MGRLFWFGIAFVLGIGLEPFWQPESFFILIAMGLIFFLSLLAEKSGELGLWLLVFLLGTLRVASLEHTELPNEGHLAGRVVFSSGKKAIIANQEHRLEGSFYPKAPSLDALVVVWYRGRPRTSQLAGGGNNDRIVHRSRVIQRRIKDWNYISQPQKQRKPAYLDDFEHGGLIWTFISGERGGISKETKELMRETGTSHLMAISGLHIGLVSGLVYWIARILLMPIFLLGWERVAIKLPLIVAVVFAYFYGEQVGWPPSAQRAVIMVGVFSLGKFLEISISLGDCLGIAAILILFREPAEFHSLSFQLSFSAVLGIVLFLPKFRSFISRKWHPLIQKTLLSIGVTTGASFGTLPLVGWYFQEFAWVGFLTNLVVMPLMASLAVPLSLVSILLPETLSLLCLCFADASIHVSLQILQLLRENPIVLAFTVLEMTLYAGLILLVRWRFWFGFLFLVAPNFQAEKENGVEIRFLAIGQGDASLIRWEDGRNWLVDGGQFSFDLVPYLRREKIFHLDQVIISHPHPDHFGGLFLVLEKLQVEKLVVSRYPEKKEAQSAKLIQLAQEKNIKIELVENWKEENISVFHPLDWKGGGADRVNEESIVFAIEYGEHRFLFTGDIEKQAEKHLEGKIGDIDVLKVPHHGSRTSSSSQLLQELKPEFSVISCGIDNRFGHPHFETLGNLKGSKILRTDQLGTIIFRSDGERLEIKTQR